MEKGVGVVVYLALPGRHRPEVVSCLWIHLFRVTLEEGDP